MPFRTEGVPFRTEGEARRWWRFGETMDGLVKAATARVEASREQRGEHLPGTTAMQRTHPSLRSVFVVGATMINKDKKVKKRASFRSTKRWFEFADAMVLAKNLLHIGLILVFVGLLVAALCGAPVLMPRYAWFVVVIFCSLAIVGLFEPLVRDIFLRRRDKVPTGREVLLTILGSTLCGMMGLALNLYSRGFFGLAPELPTHVDYQRLLMVMVYWVSELFLLQSYGIIVGVGLVILAFTGCFCGCFCNLCFSGPFYPRRRRAGTGASARASKEGRRHSALDTSRHSPDGQVHASSSNPNPNPNPNPNTVTPTPAPTLTPYRANTHTPQPQSQPCC